MGKIKTEADEKYGHDLDGWTHSLEITCLQQVVTDKEYSKVGWGLPKPVIPCLTLNKYPQTFRCRDCH